MSVTLALLHDPFELFGKEGSPRPLTQGVNLLTVACRDEKDFSDWAQSLSEQVDGLLFTDELLLHELQEKKLLLPLPYQVVGPSASDLLRTLMRRAGGVYHANLSRVMIDVGESADVLSEILQTQFRPMIVDREVWSASPGETPQQALMRRYLIAWNSGSFDLIITNQFSLLEAMRHEGINVWGLLPSVETVRIAAEKLALSVLLAREGNLGPVSVIVGLRSGRIAVDELRAPLEEYNAAHGKAFLITRRGSLLELSACALSRDDLLSGRTELEMKRSLWRGEKENAVMGWGIGVSVPHARECAMRAYRQALFDVDGGSYLVDEKNDLYGPFLEGTVAASRPENYAYLRRMARQAGISCTSMARLMQAAERIGKNNVTSEQLANCLGMTQRSAARLLANLAAHQAAELCRSAGDATRGRPAKRYKLLF